MQDADRVAPRAPVVHDEAAGMVFHEKSHVGDEVHQVAEGGDIADPGEKLPLEP